MEASQSGSKQAGFGQSSQKRHRTPEDGEDDTSALRRRRIADFLLGSDRTADSILEKNDLIFPSNSKASLISHWVREGTWPGRYFEMTPAIISSSTQANVTWFREGKNPLARDRAYEDILKNVGIYMSRDVGMSPSDDSKELYQTLLSREQTTVKDSLFSDTLFQKTMGRLQNENEAMVVQDLLPIIVPRAEILWTYGADQLKHLVGHINQAWHACVPITAGRPPKPDYAVGFQDIAFTSDQLKRLGPFVRDLKRTPFSASSVMHFPFLTCEVKCGNEALDIADRQNAHSASIAVKQVVDLYREVSRVGEIDRKIMAFFISANVDMVRIYGHYACIDGENTTFYRHLVEGFSILAKDSGARWISHKFVKNLYDVFVPAHLERIRAAIDQLPDPEAHRAKQVAEHELAQLRAQHQRAQEQVEEYLVQQKRFQRELNRLQQRQLSQEDSEQLERLQESVERLGEGVLDEKDEQQWQLIEELEPSQRPLQMRILQAGLKAIEQQVKQLREQVAQLRQTRKLRPRPHDAGPEQPPGAESQSQQPRVKPAPQRQASLGSSSLSSAHGLDLDNPPF